MTRGRDADTPLQIPRKGWFDIAMRVKGEIAKDHVGLIAAGVAFYGLLALFPAITALMALSGLILAPEQVIAQIENVSALIPEDVASIIIDQATAVAGSSEGGLGLTLLLGILLALYSASKGMNSLVEGLNIAYEETEERGFVMKKLVVLGLTVFLVVGLLVGLGAVLALPVVLSIVALGPMTEMVIGILRWVALAALTIGGLTVLYRYGPSRATARWQWVTPGAVIACVLWMAASAAFSVYVTSFGSYNETFGALGGVIVLLMWLWISAYVILMGGELNAEMEAQTKVDTTTGLDYPMGYRGAVKADVLGAAREDL